MKAITSLNKYLNIFNQEKGEYLNLIGDGKKDYPYLDGEIYINDYDNGAIANVLEYNRNLSVYFLLSLDISQASGEILTYILKEYYGYFRKMNELDEDYYQRVITSILDNKISNIAIEKKLEPYGDDISVIDGIGSGAFTDVSFIGNYQEFTLSGQSIVKPATTEVVGGRAYFFRVFIRNISPVDYKTVVDIINNHKAAGVNYIIELPEIINESVGFTDTSYLEYNDEKLDVDPVVTSGFMGS